MKKVGVSVAIVCLACLVMLFMSGENSSAMAGELPHLTEEQALAAARRNSNPGTSIKILWRAIANADTRRTGDQALDQAQVQKIEQYENGRLINILRFGGYLLAEYDWRTNSLIATHSVFMEASGSLKDIRSKCHGTVKLADAEELVKDTAELVEQLYSTTSTETSRFVNRFYGGVFPNADRYPDSLSTIPDFLRKPGAKADDIREAAALFWGYLLWDSRYSLAMSAFSANPTAAGEEAEKERDLLKAKFLQSNNMDPNLNPVDFDDVRGEQQFLERIALLKKLNGFLEDSLRREANPIVIRANLSILTMPLRVDVDPNQAGLYETASPPKSLFSWHRIVTGGFAIQEITWDW